jgi:hypothetical protein
MFIRTLLAAALVAVSSMGSSGSWYAAGHIPGKHALASQNWSGYATNDTRNGPFDSVSASWTEPDMAVPCNSASGPSLVAFWAGLDGFSTHSVEQVGTAIECVPSAGGFVVKHTGFLELFPAPPTFLGPAFPLQAGDRIHASVTFAGGVFTFTLHNDRTGQTVTARAAGSGSRGSAEVITEAPLLGPTGPVAPLLDFGRVSFDDVTVNGRAIRSLMPVAIAMESADGSTVKAMPSPLRGADFSVTWNHM